MIWILWDFEIFPVGINLLVSPNPLVLLPSRELTYPINGKENSSAQPPLDGTWLFLGRLFNIYCFVLSNIIFLRFWDSGHLHRWKQHLSCSEGAMVSMNLVSNAWRRMHVVCKTSKFSLLHFSMPRSSEKTASSVDFPTTNHLLNRLLKKAVQTFLHKVFGGFLGRLGLVHIRRTFRMSKLTSTIQQALWFAKR